MDLIFWRHADAVEHDSGGDLARPLTKKGEKQAERMAEWLDERIAASTRVLVSPAVRCQQTAQALDRPFETLTAIAPGASAEDVLDAADWPDGEGAVLVVGHQPTLGLAVSLALTGSAQHWALKKAAVWWLRSRPGDADSEVVVHAVQTPDSL